MIITLNLSKEEVLAIKRADYRALETFSQLVRFVASQAVSAQESDRGQFEFFTVVSPPIPLIETGSKGALCIPAPEEKTYGTATTHLGSEPPGIIHPTVETEVPDVFKKMKWTAVDEGEDENEDQHGV